MWGRKERRKIWAVIRESGMGYRKESCPRTLFITFLRFSGSWRMCPDFGGVFPPLKWGSRSEGEDLIFDSSNPDCPENKTTPKPKPFRKEPMTLCKLSSFPFAREYRTVLDKDLGSTVREGSVAYFLCRQVDKCYRRQRVSVTVRRA